MNKVGILSLSYGNYVRLEDYIKLEQVLNEIKEYVEKHKDIFSDLDFYKFRQDILKIIDKVGGNE